MVVLNKVSGLALPKSIAIFGFKLIQVVLS